MKKIYKLIQSTNSKILESEKKKKKPLALINKDLIENDNSKFLLEFDTSEGTEYNNSKLSTTLFENSKFLLEFDTREETEYDNSKLSLIQTFCDLLDNYNTEKSISLSKTEMLAITKLQLPIFMFNSLFCENLYKINSKQKFIITISANEDKTFYKLTYYPEKNIYNKTDIFKTQFSEKERKTLIIRLKNILVYLI